LYRLSSAIDTSGSRSYSYDPAGNRLTSGSTTSTYDRADRMLTSGSTAVTVDAKGNMTGFGANTYTFDEANHLRSATVGGSTETYVYDGDGTRFSRQIGGNPAIRYVSDVAGKLPQTISDGTRKYVYGLGLAYAVSGTTLEIYHADRLDSTRSLTNSGGTVTDRYAYNEWGTATHVSGTSAQPFAFTGQPGDATGLTYLRARYYQPSLGRFITRDTWTGNPRTCQTLNRYAYALNGPLSRNDPSGLKANVLDPGKCAYAALQVSMEAAAGYSAFRWLGVAGATSFAPMVSLTALTIAGYNAIVFALNASHTGEAVNWCLGNIQEMSYEPDWRELPEFLPPVFPRPPGLRLPALEPLPVLAP